MIVINISEFRKDIKKYTDLAQNQKVIIHRSKGESFALVPLQEIDETKYLLLVQKLIETLLKDL